ncbi:MAG: hypothetical protein Kow00128_04260 [Deltaproteobacteria bacterium]
MRRRHPFLFLLPLVAAWFLSTPATAGRGPVLLPEDLPGQDLSSNILFETSVPINELLPDRWTRSQQREILYFRERMKRDARIFLIVQATIDPIGSEEENRRWGTDLSLAVGNRLIASGIPEDRILVLPPREDPRLFSEPRWERFAARQTLTIRGYQGGEWLRRREVRAEVPAPLPPAGELRILEPAEGTTDRGRHRLRGSTEESVRSVAVAIGTQTQTAAVYGGRFEIPVSLVPGENRIVVTGLDRYGRALRAERTLRYVPPMPGIGIEHPREGEVVDITRSPVITLRGTIRSRNPLAEAFLIQNETPRPIPVRHDGSFEQRAILITDEDLFRVEAEDREGFAGVSEPRTVTAKGIAERPLLAILHWDENDVDIDLHVRDGEGRHTYFEIPDMFQGTNAIPEGKLWIDNREGYGPEAFSIEQPTRGEFTFSAEYYRGKRPCRVYLTVVLFAGSPSRKTIRKFGPIEMSPERRSASLVRVSLPEGILDDLTK